MMLVWLAAFGKNGSLRAAASFDQDIRPLFDSYCVSCHGPEKQKAGLNLAVFTNNAAIQRAPKTWQKVQQQVRDREMPPKSKPQPSNDQYTLLLEWCEQVIRHPDLAGLPPDPGHVAPRRLNRLEYNNTVRDLFGITSRPADAFPADGGGGGGFDNNADTLFVPPILMERYLEAAGKIVREAPVERLAPFKASWHISEDSIAKKTFQFQARRVFRRPPEKAEIDRFTELYRTLRKNGTAHIDAIRTVTVAMLVSPSFLFRIEPEPTAAGPVPLGDFELASRLSYFLWASTPDDALLDLAAKGRLHEPDIIEAQCRRMLLDPKVNAFAESFVGQWLGTRNLKTTTRPDPGKFPVYTDALRDAMCDEPVLCFVHQARANRPILDWLDADYTFVNAELARHYGLDTNITPNLSATLERVQLKEKNRGGLLGMGAVLTLTSYPLRTSPVLRGRWVLEEVLGTPPPPPPPLVPGLPSDDSPKEGLTFRQRLEKHREKPECASCHARMDPLGFGMENFDPIGRWRSEIGGKPVDASGELPGNLKFEGPAALKTILLQRKDLFLRNYVERMLSYALGRGLDYYDAPAIQRILERLDKEHAGAQSLVLGVATSYPFLFRPGRTQQTASLKPTDQPRLEPASARIRSAQASNQHP